MRLNITQNKSIGKGLNMIIRVSEEVSARINSAKDLNDFYAYSERNLSHRQVLNLSYDWDSISDLERIERDYLPKINYTCGVYDSANIARIFGLEG